MGEKRKRKLYNMPPRPIQYATKASQKPRREEILPKKKRPSRPHPTTKEGILSRKAGPLDALT
jgi:hypothetical protein